MFQLSYRQILNDQIIEKKLDVPLQFLSKNCRKVSLFTIQIEGTSMEPLILDKTILIGDLSQNIFKEKGLYLIQGNNDLLIKQGAIIDQKQRLISINKNYSNFTFKLDEIRILAKIVCSYNAAKRKFINLDL